MRSGDLRKRMLLQKKAVTPVLDGDGNDITPWTDIGYFWVQAAVPSVLAASGARGEREEAGQLEQLRPHALTVRGNLRGIINHNCRFILDGNRILEIKDVTDLGELHRQLRVDAIEKVY